MRSLLDKLISPVQNAFIPGRSSHDNILLTHEIMHKFKNLKSRTSWVAIKLDMEKACDRLEWDFILKFLPELGFHPLWNKWIMEIISSVSYLVIVNDEPNGLFNPSMGIRQGGPLSPYICIICMESLNYLLCKEAREQKSGIGIKLGPGTATISYLMFADVCLLFCRTNSNSFSVLKNTLDKFAIHLTD